MRLAEFILDNMEAILAEWEAFAATLLPAARGMTPRDLRDHAQAILKAVARDISTPQTRHEQSEKSKGRAPEEEGAPETAAQTHALMRGVSGFDIVQLVAEYRALRACVLRLWMDTYSLNETAFDDMLRFNEAIDQAVAESVGHFHAQWERARNLFLGVVGHDMRAPLSAIIATASRLAALGAGDQVSAAAERLIRSGGAIQTLLDDLADFNRTQLGLGLNVEPSEIDLAATLTDELEQLRAAQPGRDIELTVTGDNRGWWDGARLQQLVRNLVSNAIKHGSPATPVRVALRGGEAAVHLEVTNQGPAIDPAIKQQIFDPLKRAATHGGTNAASGGLGLGLFIVREIAESHGGEVEVRSEGEETTFAVRLPRHVEGVVA